MYESLKLEKHTYLRRGIHYAVMGELTRTYRKHLT